MGEPANISQEKLISIWTFHREKRLTYWEKSWHKPRQPDFKRTFDLTTDASGFGLGAVLSQDGRPITMISRVLRDSEKNYATNERKLFAFIWKLKNLRNYLYGVRPCRSLPITSHLPFLSRTKILTQSWSAGRRLLTSMAQNWFINQAKKNSSQSRCLVRT